MEYSTEGPIGGKVVSLEEYRKRREERGLGVEEYLVDLEKGFSKEDVKVAAMAGDEIEKMLNDPKTADPEAEAVNVALRLSHGNLSLWALGFSSQRFVEKTDGKADKKEKDLMAGRMLDNLAERFLKEKMSQQTLTTQIPKVGQSGPKGQPRR